MGGTMAPVMLWVSIILAGAATYAIRLSFILLAGRRQFPNWVQKALEYTPAAVLFAIIAPGVLYFDDRFALTWQNPQIVPALLAALVAWRTRKPLFSLVVGLVAFGLLFWLL